MVWFHVDDGLAYHKKAIEAGNAAIGLWVRAGAWSTGSLTDGFIPNAIARSIGTPKQVQKLVDCGLWVKVPGGYSFHDWDHRQFTKEEIEQKREKERARKREQRQRQNVPAGRPPDDRADVPPDDPEDVPPPVREESLYARAQALPHPTPPLSTSVVTKEGEGHVSNGHALEDPPPKFCPAHRPDGTTDNCGPCKSYRLIYERWLQNQNLATKEATQEAARAAAAERADALQAEAADRAQSIADCQLCNKDGYRGATVCTHQEHSTPQGRAAALATVAATLGKAPQ